MLNVLLFRVVATTLNKVYGDGDDSKQ